MTMQEFADHVGLTREAVRLCLRDGMPHEPAKPLTIDPKAAIAWRKEHKKKGRRSKTKAA